MTDNEKLIEEAYRLAVTDRISSEPVVDLLIRLADALEASDKSHAPAAPEPEWEYAVGNVRKRVPYISESTYGSAEEARWEIWPGAVVLRRRPAGEWEVDGGEVPVAR